MRFQGISLREPFMKSQIQVQGIGKAVTAGWKRDTWYWRIRADLQSKAEPPQIDQSNKVAGSAKFSFSKYSVEQLSENRIIRDFFLFSYFSDDHDIFRIWFLFKLPQQTGDLSNSVCHGVVLKYSVHASWKCHMESRLFNTCTEHAHMYTRF